MRKISFCLLFLLVVSSLKVVAQDQGRFYSPGWVVLNSGDSIFGSVYNKNMTGNPREIKFIPKKGSSVSTYKVEDLRAFGIEGESAYERYPIQYHLVPFDETIEYSSNEDSIQSSTEWVKILVKSAISLGEYNSKDRVYFYYIINNKAEELIYSKGIKNFGGEKYENDERFGKVLVSENPFFRRQLFDLNINVLSKGDISKEINASEYNTYSLSSLFRKLNQVKGGDKEKSDNSLFVGVGVSLFSHTTSGIPGGYIQNSTTINNNTSPYITFGYLIKGSKKDNKVYFYSQLAFSTLNTTGNDFSNITGGNVQYDIKNTFIEFELLPSYVFNPYDDVKFSAGLGMNLMFMASGNNVQRVYNTGGGLNLETQGVPQQKSVIGCPVFALNLFTKRVTIFANYQISGNLTNYTNQSWKFSRITGGIFYGFKKGSEKK